MPKKRLRVFSRAFKLAAVRRMTAGENVSALSRELQVLRKDLYYWRTRFRSGGPEALRGKGRPKKIEGRAAAAEGAARRGREGLRADCRAGTQDRPATGRSRFFSASLAANRGSTPAERRAWRATVYTVIQTMTTPLLQGEPTIARMCTLARVSRAGYYRNWAASTPRQEETAVRDMVQRVALAEKHYGYRRVAFELRRAGVVVNHKRVLRLMRQDNLLRLRRRAFVPATTDSNHGWRIVPNLTYGIVLTGIDQLWVADITYIRMLEEFAYLAVVLDAFSRRVIGWALETHLQASLAIAALNMALATRRPAPGSLIHHSDRGVQYACHDYTDLLETHDIQPSMSRIGCPYDNAKAESFMKTLKQEEIDGRAYRDMDQARSAIGTFFEDVYNRHRLHSALAYRPPAEFEANLPSIRDAAPRPLSAVPATCP